MPSEAFPSKVISGAAFPRSPRSWRGDGGGNAVNQCAVAGEIGPSDAEGATAPETLRQKDRDSMTQRLLERGTLEVSADGIIISGKQTEGAHDEADHSDSRRCAPWHHRLNYTSTKYATLPSSHRRSTGLRLAPHRPLPRRRPGDAARPSAPTHLDALIAETVPGSILDPGQLTFGPALYRDRDPRLPSPGRGQKSGAHLLHRPGLLRNRSSPPSSSATSSKTPPGTPPTPPTSRRSARAVSKPSSTSRP